MAYEQDDESTEIKDLKEKIELLRDIQYEESESVGEENATGSVYDQQGKFRSDTGGGTGGSGYTTIQDEGVSLTQRSIMNFIGADVVAVDNPGDNRTDITITGGGGGEFFGPWTAAHDAGSKALNKLSSIEMTDAAAQIQGLIQGVTNTGIRVQLVAAKKFQFFDGAITSILEISLAGGLDLKSHKITNALFIESNVANRPGSGFIRMATAQEIRMRNPVNNDDLIITSGNVINPTAQMVQGLIFKVAGGERLTISQLHIDVKQNGIVNTGDITPSGTGGQVGDSTNFYNQMSSQFFTPVPAAILLQRYALAKTGNLLYVNFVKDNTLAGFGIFREGIRRFLFNTTGTDPAALKHSFHLGPATFTAGESYEIVFGENSNSSGLISFIEGSGNDFIIDKKGASTTTGVQIRGSGLTKVIFFSDKIKIFQPITNVTSIFPISDTVGNIGGLSTGTAPFSYGFDYFLRDKIKWHLNPDTFIQFTNNGIFLESDSKIDLKTNGVSEHITITAAGTTSDITINSTRFTRISTGLVNYWGTQDNILVANGANIFMANGAQEIQFADNVTEGNVSTPASNIIALFNNADDEILTVKKDTGNFHQVENIANLADVANRSGHWVRLPVVDSTTSIASINIIFIEQVAGTFDGSMCIFTNSASPATPPFLLIKAVNNWYYMEIGTTVGTTATGRRTADIPFTPHRRTPYTRDNSTAYLTANWPNQNFPGIIALAANAAVAGTFYLLRSTGSVVSDPGTFKAGAFILGSDEPGILTGQLPIAASGSLTADQADELGGPDDGSCCIGNDDLLVKANGRWFKEDF